VQDALATVEAGSHRHFLSLSGGKESIALALYMRYTYPQHPFKCIFCDAGGELPGTYEYLDRLEAVLGARIVRLSALDRVNVKHMAGRTPFDVWLNEIYGGYLPNPRVRWCTWVLKIQLFEAHVGTNLVFSYIGIRSDENQEGYTAKKPPVLSEQPNILAVYTFKDDGSRLEDINDLLQDSGLGLPKYYRWRTRSGCYPCFYQQIGERQELQDRHPRLFERSKAYENSENGHRFTWAQRRSLADIERLERCHELADRQDLEGCAICHL